MTKLLDHLQTRAKHCDVLRLLRIVCQYSAGPCRGGLPVTILGCPSMSELRILGYLRSRQKSDTMRECDCVGLVSGDALSRVLYSKGIDAHRLQGSKGGEVQLAQGLPKRTFKLKQGAVSRVLPSRPRILTYRKEDTLLHRPSCHLHRTPLGT